MPLPLFLRTPRPEEHTSPDASPASQTSSRFGALHNNVRSIINGSSVYSNSPAPSNTNTPNIPFFGFMRRGQSPPNPVTIPDNNDPRVTNDLRPQHTAGSYMRTIAPLQPRQRDEHVHRHPADVPLPATAHTRQDDTHVDPEDPIQELAGNPETSVRQHRQHHRRKKRKHGHHRKHQRHTHWVRRRRERNICFGFVKTQAARSKLFASLISGMFLATVTAIYLALALTRRTLNQEIHILFIMLILAITIFFCHSLIRLFMLALHPPQETPRIPSMTGPDGFHPVRPIRVHVARDEELALEDDDIDPADADTREDGDEEKKVRAKVTQPPPAYGLWRSSVRVDPNLLHWQRVDAVEGHVDVGGGARGPANRDSRAPLANSSRNGSSSSLPQEQQYGPRPPSYVSDDGVSYVVEAAPRSTVYGGVQGVPGSGVSDIHPAWRPGGYPVSEVHIGDGAHWPLPLRV